MANPGSFPCPRCGESLPFGFTRCDACGAYVVPHPPGSESSARTEGASASRARPSSGQKPDAREARPVVPSTAWVFLLAGLLSGGAIGYALHGSVGAREREEDGGMPAAGSSAMGAMGSQGSEGGPAMGGPATAGATAGGPPPGAQMPPEVMAMVQQYRAALAKDPDDVQANIGLGNLLFDSAQWDKAVDHYGRALAKEPGNPDVRVDMAVAYHNLGQDQRAREEIERVTRDHPDHKQAWLNLGVVSATMGDRAGAIRAWERYLALDPNGPHATEIRAQIEELRKQS